MRVRRVLVLAAMRGHIRVRGRAVTGHLLAASALITISRPLTLLVLIANRQRGQRRD